MQDGQEQRMFDFHPAHRNTDPPTSKMAEDEITNSGVRLTQAMRVLGLVKRNTGFTSAEYASITKLNRHMMARRLPDLKENGYIRRGLYRQCGVSHRRAVTWWFVKDPDPPASAGY